MGTFCKLIGCRSLDALLCLEFRHLVKRISALYWLPSHYVTNPTKVNLTPSASCPAGRPTACPIASISVNESSYPVPIIADISILFFLLKSLTPTTRNANPQNPRVPRGVRLVVRGVSPLGAAACGRCARVRLPLYIPLVSAGCEQLNLWPASWKPGPLTRG